MPGFIDKLRQLGRTNTGAPANDAALAKRRTTVELELCRQAMQPGHFEEMSQQVRDKVVRIIRAQLSTISLEFLEEAADPGPNHPTILLDENLKVSFALRTQGTAIRGVDPLEVEAELMAQANAQGLLFHGYDPSGVPIITNMDQLSTHMAVVGTSGTGKSTQLARYFVQLAMQGGPMMLIDPHGTLIQDVLARLPVHRRKDVVYITPDDVERGWGINLLQVARHMRHSKNKALSPAQTESVIETTVQTMVKSLSQIQEDESGLAAGISIQATLEMFAQAAAEYLDASFTDVYAIVTSRVIQQLIKRDIRNPNVREYFENIVPDLRTEYVERVRNKLQKFVSSTVMVNMFSRRKECTDLKTLIDGNKIILFDLNRKGGLPYQISNLIGFVIVTLTMLVVDHRQVDAGEKLKPFYMMIDEFQNVASKSTVRWFTEARKQNASLIVAFQHLNQLSEDVRNALGNASTWCAFRSTPQDARVLAPMLGLGSAVKGDVSELIEVPQFEMRLRYDEEDVQAETRPMKRSLVTVKCPPLQRAPANAEKVIAMIKEYSRRHYTLPHNPTDKETILGAADASTIDVLLSVYEAHLAICNAKGYLWGSGVHPKTRWAIDNQLATSSVAHHILSAKGITMSWERFGGLKEALIRRGLVKVGGGQSGYDQVSVTTKGRDEIIRYIDPNKSQMEGGPRHRFGVRRLFVGLSRLAPVKIVVPSQSMQVYTPDLVGEVPQERQSDAFFRRITDKAAIHFHLEESTRTKPDKAMSNVLRAYEAKAFPVLVIQAPKSDKEALSLASDFFDRLREDAIGNDSAPAREALRQALVQDPHNLFAVWVVTSDNGLYEFEPQAKRLALIGADYRGAGVKVKAELKVSQEVAKPAIPATKPKPKTPKPEDGAQRKLPEGQATGPPVIAEPPPPRPPASPAVALAAQELFRKIISEEMLAGAASTMSRSAVKAKMAGHEAGLRVSDGELDGWALSLFGMKICDTPNGVEYRLR